MQKLKLIYLLRIFEEQTDDEHALPAVKLVEELQKLGIRAERKSLYDDIKVLISAGYDIMVSRSASNVGFYLGRRAFELPEVRILMDAVLSASFITPKKSEELITKLQKLTSSHQAFNIARQVYVDKRAKCTNEEILYNIDTIHRAIAMKRRIFFTYHHTTLIGNRPRLGEGKPFELSPYALLWENDRYYLVGNYHKYENLSHYRVDRMKRVEILGADARSFEEVSTYRGTFNTADYVKRNFNMFGGHMITAKLLCEKRAFEILLDKFGQDIAVKKMPEERYSVVIRANFSEGLIEWLIQFGDMIEVLHPPELRSGLLQKLAEIAQNYGIRAEGISGSSEPPEDLLKKH